MDLNKYPNSIYLGVLDGVSYYLLKPEWQCGWYWAYSWMTNYDDDHMHYQFGFIRELTNTYLDDDEKWLIEECMQTVKQLKATAEVFRRGGSHVTAKNPCKELLQDSSLVSKINQELIPKQLEIVWDILTKPSRLENFKYE